MKVLQYWPIFLIVTLVGILGFINFVPGTILTGGDNLHPEFNLTLNIHRSLHAVWQEYQGPGLLGGMGHSADLIRQLLLYPITLLFPMENVRYVWTILTLAIGGIGAYFLIQSLLTYLATSRDNRIFALSGALFYILNLSTVQSYFTPFETFTSHFAALPWLLLTTVNYVVRPTKKTLFWLLLTVLFATPQNYVPTIFVVTMLAIGILLPFLLSYKEHFLFSKKSLFRSIKLFLIFISINAFWLLPFLLFTLTKSDINVNSRINQMATETIYLQNKEFGNIANVMLLKGFWFNSVDTNKEGINNFMLAPWRDHLTIPGIIAIGYFLFSIVLLGVIPIVKQRNILLIGFAALLLFSFTMLTTATAPFSWFNELFRLLPLMNQAFRFPFTKFSILASLLYSIFFSFGIYYLSEILKKRIHGLSVPFINFMMIALIITYTLPLFRGNLFYEKEQVTLPSEYKELMNFFNYQDPATRIANFPQHTFWSWNFYNFDYTGSGFLWYGIPQPILDRAFDPWSEESESYFTEISQAIYSKNSQQFIDVLDKYDVTWILIDNNVTHPTAPKSLFTNEIKLLAESSDRISLTWKKGGLAVYKINSRYPSSEFVSLYTQLPSVNANTLLSNDFAYRDLGIYTSTEKINYYYPFRAFPTGKITNETYPTFEENEDSITISHTLPAFDPGYTVSIPEYIDQEKIVPVSVYHSSPAEGKSVIGLVIKTPEIYLDTEHVSGGTTDIVVFNLPSNIQYPLQLRINESQQYTFRSNSYANTNTFISAGQINYLVLTDSTGKTIGATTINTKDLQDTGIFSEKTFTMPSSTSPKTLSIVYPKITDNFLNYQLNPAFLTPSDCNVFRNGINTHTISEPNIITFTSKNDSQCSATYSPSLLHDIGYILFIKGMNNDGNGLHVWVLNEDQGYAPLDFYLPQKRSSIVQNYVLPPQEDFGKAYSFHFDTISIGNDVVSNTLEGFSLYPIPYNFISSIQLITDSVHSQALSTVSVKRISEFMYSATLSPGNSSPATIVLSQSYDNGWNAYQFKEEPNIIQTYLPFLSGQKITKHIKVNSWSNGWVIDDLQKPNIILMYTPQWLQYAGFIVLFGIIPFLFIKSIKSSEK